MALYVSMLVEAYQEKKLKNPQFSMNAFARHIGLAPSQYNEVLKGKCGLSQKRASEISSRLNFTDFQKRFFCLSVDAEHSRSDSDKKKAKAELRQLKKNVSVQLQVETFALISSWYHFAILELINLRDFKADEVWIARRLNIDRGIVKNAIQRLKKLELIKVKEGEWVRSDGLVKTTDDIPSIGIKKYHSQLLGLAERALFKVPVEKREFNSVFLSIDKALMPEAKRRIRKFQEKMVKDLSSKSKKKNSLVGLNIQMFPLAESD